MTFTLQEPSKQLSVFSLSDSLLLSPNALLEGSRQPDSVRDYFNLLPWHTISAPEDHGKPKGMFWQLRIHGAVADQLAVT